MYNLGEIMLPLILRLKKVGHKEIAQAQDILVNELYSYFPSAVLHGGTAIWRCYHGQRFSEDIDVYILKDEEKLDLFFQEMERKGFRITKRRIRENSLYSTLQWNRVEIRFEALFIAKKGILKEYETAESNYITVYTLSPEALIEEKVAAYLNRLKVRDLYDIFFLLRFVSDKKSIASSLKRLLTNFCDPVDKHDLQILVLEGLIPTVEDMVTYMKRLL
jgi:predicted nucleotidyltransferase component of viral defense system